MAQNAREQKLYADQRKSKKLFVTMLLLTLLAMGTAVISNGWAWVAAVVFALFAVIFFLNSSPDASYLGFNESGLKIKTLFKVSEYIWEDFETFKVVDFGGRKWVGFNFSKVYLMKHSNANNLSNKLSGSDGLLPELYGKEPDELTTILNEFLPNRALT